MASKALIEAVAVTCELTGTELSKAAKDAMVAELGEYPERIVIQALHGCRRELKTRLTLSAVLERMEGGHPGAEEAWAMIPKNEHGSVVWTQEMAEAFGVAVPLLMDGDTVAARMAFKEAYDNRVRLARSLGRIFPKWTPSLGRDKQGRLAALAAAVERGRITRQRAIALIPDFAERIPSQLALGPPSTDGPKQIGAILKSIGIQRKDDAA